MDAGVGDFFSALFCPVLSSTHLARYHLPGYGALCFLYAWVIASPGGEPRITHTNTKSENLGELGVRFRFHRVVLTGTPETVQRVVTAMIDGATFGEAVGEVGRSMPKPYDAVQRPYDALRLGVDSADMAQRFDPAPVRFLPTSSASSAWSDWGRPLSSPSKSQPAFVAALVRCGKAGLFADPANKPLPGADHLARQALLYLQAETGLDFAATDASRLGNLEWIALPAADSREHAAVRWLTVKNGSGDRVRAVGVRVHVAPGRLPQGTRILVRCRVLAAHEPAADVCVESEVGKETDFPVEHEITAVLITIWRLDEQGRWTLWFEDQVPLMRQVSFAMGLIGLSGSLETEWSAALKTSRKDGRARADRVRAIQQVHYESPGGVGQWAAWESAQREGEELARRLFPKKSSARFFARGWTGEAHLSFVEWLRGLTDDSSVTSIILIDPFFDDHGVREFLARVKSTQIEYVILTNSQVMSKDDPQPPSKDKPKDEWSFQQCITGISRRFTRVFHKKAAAPPTSPERVSQRAARIAAECEKMKGILSHLQFRIVSRTAWSVPPSLR